MTGREMLGESKRGKFGGTTILAWRALIKGVPYMVVWREDTGAISFSYLRYMHRGQDVWSPPLEMSKHWSPQPDPLGATLAVEGWHSVVAEDENGILRSTA
jgi:hypothetical protein